ncbi:hypothetical protein BDR22DRAFT_860119 [Usnea florida]
MDGVKEPDSVEEMARRIKELEEDARKAKLREQKAKEREQKAKERERKAKEDATKAKKGEQKARDEADQARDERDQDRKRVQNTNLPEFLDAVHVHLSNNVRVQTNAKFTTKGTIPDPVDKVCPKFFREWNDFDECQARKWAKVVETTDDFSSAREFKSLHFLEEQGSDIRKKLIGSEKTLERIERVALEINVELLLEKLSMHDAKADKLGLRGGIVFEDHDNTLSDAFDETQQRLETLTLTTPLKQTGDIKRFRPGNKSYPDAFCVYRRDDQQQVPLAAVELKPPHKLPIPVLLAGMRDMDLLKEVVNRELIPVKEVDPEAHFQYQADRWVAAAVTQTFSYIIENGLEYGYLGTGEAYVFLRVHENNPDTVYYRLCIPRQEVGKETGWGPDSDHESRLHLTAVSQVSAFCLQAVETKPRSQKWQKEAREMLPTWKVAFDAEVGQIPEEDRKEMVFSPYQPSIKRFRNGNFPKTPEIFRSRKAGSKTFASCAPAPDSHRETGSPDSSDSENDSEGPTQQPTPSKPPKKAAGNAAGKQKKGTGKEREYCTQRCLSGIMDQGEFDDQCPNVLEHARESTDHHHNLDSQDFLWLIQQQLAEDRDADCYPLWIQGARGAMFKVSLASHGYTVAAKATVFAYVTDLKHEQAVYECLRTLQGTYVPVCLGGIDLHVPYYHRGVELIHMMFMAWGGEALRECREILGHVEKDVSQMAAEGMEAMHALGVLHRDVATRNMLWNGECGRVMFVDFERSVVFETGQKQRQPLGVISANRKRKMAVITGDETCQSPTKVNGKTAASEDKRVLFKNRFDETSDYTQNPYAFEHEVSYSRRVAVAWTR